MNLQENIKRIREVMGLITEDKDEKLPVKIYPNGEGSDNAAEYEGEIITIPIIDTIPNEPFKDVSYMEGNDSIRNMIRSIDKGEELPPIKVIEHPYDSSKYLVVDGNHRRYALNKSNKEDITAIVIPHEDVLLMKNKWGSKDNTGIKLSDVNKEEIIDLYFVQPDGNNSFENETKEIEEEKESGEKWIKCRNCKKKYTQTIHKGKKSLPICPHCGTRNLDENKQSHESSGWGNSSDKLSKNFKFDSFEEAMDFIDKVAKIAEKQNHHPKITNDYNKVNISITDHEKGGVSDKCHKFVDAVNKIDTKSEMKEGLHDTSWENEKGDKVTLVDLLNATEDIPVKNVSVEKLKPKLLSWDGDDEEIAKIEKADLQYPILIFVDDNNKFLSIIDGHHRAQKAVRNKLKSIKAKIIPVNTLPNKFKRVFGHITKGEQKEGELTEKCWPGYKQKGMKTMFGKRYPNCVKKSK